MCCKVLFFAQTFNYEIKKAPDVLYSLFSPVVIAFEFIFSDIFHEKKKFY